METNFIKLYIDLNKLLLKTMVIKSEASISLTNEYLTLKYGNSAVNQDQPSTWKYYMNISGEYHTTDQMMTVTSLDTLEEINFTKENLLSHTSTAEHYSYGTRYYYNLLRRYPEQRQLILGILYPCDKEKAIEAQNGTILTYPEHLVEPQEVTLINELQDYIYRYIIRWDVKAFGISDSLYHTAQHAVMYLNILPRLLNLRLKRCKTPEAHTFHIRNYLASHGRLDKYIPYMTLKQILFLYRNIRYLNRNSGKVEQFKTLVDKLLTDRKIPLSEFSVRHFSDFDESYRPEINIRRKPVNTQFNIPEKNYFSLDILYEKERHLVYGNDRYFSAHENRITKLLKHSTSSIMQTKDLESSMIDYNDAVPDTLEAVMMRQWISMASKGDYIAIINFKDPKTSEIYQLNALNAFIYMYYLSLKSINVDVIDVPSFINIKARKKIMPSVDEMFSVVDNDREYRDLKELATYIRSRQPVLPMTPSTQLFYNLTYRVYEESLWHWFLVSNTHDLYRRGIIDNMIYTLYEDQSIVFDTPVTNMTEWLFINNLPEYNYTYSEAQELIKDIFIRSTGINTDDSRLLSNIQKAMLAIFKQLSSYTIQFINDINLSKIKPLNWAAIRPGNIRRSSKSKLLIRHPVRVISSHGRNRILTSIETVVNKRHDKIYVKKHHNTFINIGITNTVNHRGYFLIPTYFKAFNVDATYEGQDAAISRDSPFIGMEYYLALSEEEREQLISIY